MNGLKIPDFLKKSGICIVISATLYYFFTQGCRMVNAQNQPELESIVQQIGEAVLATIETVEHLSQRMDALASQVQQQGYQIFALTDAVQTLTEAQQASLQRLDRLTDALENLVTAVDPSDVPPP